MTKPTGYCWAGFYCTSGATEANETVCPPGQYCIDGTYTPSLCPNGTFRNATGGRSISECTQCTGGKYCNGDGLTSPSGDCEKGYV